MAIESITIEEQNTSESLIEKMESSRINQTAFREFYSKTAPALRSYISRSCGSYDLAEDIMQEAFLRFLRTAPADMEGPAMKGYLYRTADTLLIDHWRREKRSKRWSLEMIFRKEQTPDRSASDDMSEAFRVLKPQQRSLLWLAYVEGFDHREIADAAGVKEGSVKVLLFRARKALAAVLEGK
jgi:RNA polymerase sigma-70 factor (ECF subfamily)